MQYFIGSKKKAFLSNIYLFSYLCFVFTQILFRDSQLGNIGSTVIICYIFIGLSILVNIYIYIFYNNLHNNLLLSILFIIICLLFFIFSLLFRITIIMPLLFTIFLFIFNSNLVQFDSLIKVDFFTRLSSISLVFLLLFLHMLPVSNRPNVISHNGSFFRYSLGFNHPNNLGIVILVLLISGFMLSEQLDKKCYVLLVIILLLFYCVVSLFSDSRELEICGIIIIISLFFVRFRLWLILFKILAIPSILLSLVLFIYVIHNFDPNSSFYITLNKFSSGRLYFQSQINSLYPPNLFGYKGTDVNFLGQSISSDNLYSSMLLHSGMVGLIIYELLLVLIPIIFIKIRNNYTNIFIVVLSLCSFASSFSPDLMSVLVLICSFDFYKMKKDELYEN